MKNVIFLVISPFLLIASAHATKHDFNSMISDGVKAEQALVNTLRGKIGDNRISMERRGRQILRVDGDIRPVEVSASAIPHSQTGDSELEPLLTAEEMMSEELLGLSEF